MSGWHCSRRAFAYAHDAEAERLEILTLEIDRLYAAGLTISDLRWLVAKGFVEHGQESSVYGHPHRSFRRGAGFFFDDTTCVVFTPTGTAFAGHVLKEPMGSPRSAQRIEAASLGGGATARTKTSPRQANDQSGSTSARSSRSGINAA